MRLGKRRGFTLVELLIVVGILVSLVGVLLPAINRAREQGRRVECLANLRALTQGWLAYASANDGHFCSSDSGSPFGWVTAVAGVTGLQGGKLWLYVNNATVYRCPDDPTPIDPLPNQITNACSYQINGMLAGSVGDPFPRTKLNDLTAASKTFVFIEGCAQVGLLGACFKTPIYPSPTFGTNALKPPVGDQIIPTQQYVANCLPGENHHGKANTVAGTGISFADGHAIFWDYSDPRTGDLLSAALGGSNNSGNKDAPIAGLGVNSSDVAQLEAWSGATLLPPGVTQ